MEILHKAKRKDTGEWVKGYYCRYQPCASKNEYINGIIPSYASELYIVETDPETVCVYTGMKDKDGRRIWENDIIVAWSEGKKAIGIVKKRIDGLYIIYPSYHMKEFWGLCPNNSGKTTVKIVGNKFDNPEMLEVE